MALFDEPRNNKNLEIDENHLEIPGVRPIWERGDPGAPAIPGLFPSQYAILKIFKAIRIYSNLSLPLYFLRFCILGC